MTTKIPPGTKPRKPDALLRGKAYKVTEFVAEKSKFPDKDGNPIIKTIALYTDFRVKFYTYLPKEFDNQTEEQLDKLNNSIKSGKNVRIVFYGKIGVSNEMEILTEGQGKLFMSPLLHIKTISRIVSFINRLLIYRSRHRKARRHPID